jgi:hypothetical protein
MLIRAEQVPDTSSGLGALLAEVQNETGGHVFSEGSGSGQINRVYYRKRSGLGASSTDSYNFLAAGSLLDLLKQTVDLDKLKILAVKCTAGAIRLDAPAANAIGIFSDPSDVIRLMTGQMVVFDFGDGGLDVTTNASLDIVETSGGATADYTIIAVGAN